MQIKDTLLIDVSDTIKIINDRLKILFHDDVFPDLVFQLAMDAWNVRFICSDSEDVITKIVQDKINRFLSGEEEYKKEIIALIVSCIRDILIDLGMTIYTIVPHGISYIQYESIDQYNNIRIKVIYDNFNIE